MTETITKVYERERNLIEQTFESDPDLAEDLSVEHMFCTYIVNFLEDKGYIWRGHNIRNQGWSVLLIVKAAHGDIPLVAFVSERTTTRCMRVFLRKLADGEVNWQKDKFA